MATLREFQMALQEKLEEIRERDDFIEELEEEIFEKAASIEHLRLELAKYKSLVKALQSSHNSAAHHQNNPLARRCSSSGFQKRHFPSVRFKELKTRTNSQGSLSLNNLKILDSNTPNVGTSKLTTAKSVDHSGKDKHVAKH